MLSATPSHVIEKLSEASLLTVYKQVTEGRMATTALVEVQWNDGTQTRAYLKAFSNALGLGVLNEITGYVLAKSLALPLPTHAGILPIPPNLLKNQEGYYPYAFVCSELEGGTPNSIYQIPDQACAHHFAPVIKLIQNWPFLPLCFNFDDWTATTDRHLGNVLLSHTGELSLIDHSNLPISPQWQAADLDENKDYDNKLLEIIGFTDKTALPNKSTLLLAAKGHTVAHKQAESELSFWWDLFLSNDNDRHSALSHFIRHRASSRHPLWCTKLNQLGV